MMDWSLLIGTGTSALTALVFWRYTVKRREVAALESAECFSKGDNILTRLEQNGSIPYAAVTGICVADTGNLKGTLPDYPNAVCLQTVIREVNKSWNKLSESWEDAKKVISHCRNSVPFHLQVGCINVSVKDPLNADVLDLPTKDIRFDPVSKSKFDVFADFLKGEEHRGIEVSQEALIEGTEITGIGTLRLVDNAMVQLCQPDNGLKYQLRASSFSRIVNEARDSYSFLRKLCVFLACLSGTIFIFWAQKKFIRWFLQRKERQLTENLNAETLRRQTDNSTCVICMERPKNVLILPCGHLCCCRHCISCIENCPICRNSVERTVPFYNS